MGLDQDVSEWELVGLIEKYLGSVDRVVEHLIQKQTDMVWAASAFAAFVFAVYFQECVRVRTCGTVTRKGKHKPPTGLDPVAAARQEASRTNSLSWTLAVRRCAHFSQKNVLRRANFAWKNKLRHSSKKKTGHESLI
jgi:hypothetical protein